MSDQALITQLKITGLHIRGLRSIELADRSGDAKERPQELLIGVPFKVDDDALG